MNQAMSDPQEWDRSQWLLTAWWSQRTKVSSTCCKPCRRKMLHTTLEKNMLWRRRAKAASFLRRWNNTMASLVESFQSSWPIYVGKMWDICGVGIWWQTLKQLLAFLLSWRKMDMISASSSCSVRQTTCLVTLRRELILEWVVVLRWLGFSWKKITCVSQLVMRILLLPMSRDVKLAGCPSYVGFRCLGPSWSRPATTD